MVSLHVRRNLRIGVMGAGSCDTDTARLAREVGREIGRTGAILICGGRGGVMEECARGAKEAGGLTVGILPGSNPEDANDWIDLPIATDLGNARNVINVLTSDVIIAIRGGSGTLSEIALALKVGTPVIGLETWELTPPPGQSIPSVCRVDTPASAVATAARIARDRRTPDR